MKMKYRFFREIYETNDYLVCIIAPFDGKAFIHVSDRNGNPITNFWSIDECLDWLDDQAELIYPV